MPERPKPNVDSVRDAMRERDDRSAGDEPESAPPRDEPPESDDEPPESDDEPEEDSGG